MNGILNRKNNNNILGGNSDTHRDCVSCSVDGPITHPNSKFSTIQLSFSNVRIRCTACVNVQRHKIHVTDHPLEVIIVIAMSVDFCYQFIQLLVAGN